MKKYTIQHKTSYTYLGPVSLCHNIARLMPRNTEEQTCSNTTIHIEPKPDRINEYEDFFGNKVIYFSIEKEHWELTVDVTSEVERKKSDKVKMQIQPFANLEDIKLELLKEGAASMEIKQYLFDTPMTGFNEEILLYALKSFTPGRSVFEATEELTHRIYLSLIHI